MEADLLSPNGTCYLAAAGIGVSLSCHFGDSLLTGGCMSEIAHCRHGRWSEALKLQLFPWREKEVPGGLMRVTQE